MIVRLVQVCLILISAAWLAACAQATPTERVTFVTATPFSQGATPVSGSAGAAGATSAAPNGTPLPTLLPTVTLPSGTPLPTFQPISTAQATTPLPTFTVLALATPERTPPGTLVVPGRPSRIYVTSLSPSPVRPVRGQGVSFFAQFLNTTGTPQPFSWLVLIYRSGANRPFGETAAGQISVPPGATGFSTPNNWKIPAAGGCESFFAQANWQDADKVRTPFNSPDGSPVTINFDVCPP